MTHKQIRKARLEAMTANFADALFNHDELNKSLDEASEALNKYPKGEMGLTPDHIKATREWQLDRQTFDNSMRNLREFNQVMLKKFKKEYRTHVQQKRGY